ncbi:hypothetical protein C0J52_11356 [Blattella germanica]|nr:hypothetical protein C0J52_11356 [Blattella germanica]
MVVIFIDNVYYKKKQTNDSFICKPTLNNNLRVVSFEFPRYTNLITAMSTTMTKSWQHHT